MKVGRNWIWSDSCADNDTELCFFYHFTGWCRSGDLCRFSHEKESDADYGEFEVATGANGAQGTHGDVAADTRRFTPCIHFKRGYCKNGQACRYGHGHVYEPNEKGAGAHGAHSHSGSSTETCAKPYKYSNLSGGQATPAAPHDEACADRARAKVKKQVATIEDKLAHNATRSWIPKVTAVADRAQSRNNDEDATRRNDVAGKHSNGGKADVLAAIDATHRMHEDAGRAWTRPRNDILKRTERRQRQKLRQQQDAGSNAAYKHLDFQLHAGGSLDGSGEGFDNMQEHNGRDSDEVTQADISEGKPETNFVKATPAHGADSGGDKEADSGGEKKAVATTAPSAADGPGPLPCGGGDEPGGSAGVDIHGPACRQGGRGGKGGSPSGGGDDSVCPRTAPPLTLWATLPQASRYRALSTTALVIKRCMSLDMALIVLMTQRSQKG